MVVEGFYNLLNSRGHIWSSMPVFDCHVFGYGFSVLNKLCDMLLFPEVLLFVFETFH